MLTFWFQLLKKFSMKCVLGIKIEEKNQNLKEKSKLNKKTFDLNWGLELEKKCSLMFKVSHIQGRGPK